MVVKDKNIEKMYSSYVSEFHLEMILIPFINGKIEKKENIIIETEQLDFKVEKGDFMI